mgnify:FL=1
MKHYVGITRPGQYVAFRSLDEPTREMYDQSFVAVIGPFRTRCAAKLAEKYGRSNPHFQHVNDAERLSKE